jgi:hypothetical protein
MPKLVFFLLLLPQALSAQGEANAADPIRDITLNAGLMQNDPGLLASDSVGIIVEARAAAFYKLSARDVVVASGQLLSGSNFLLVSCPGMFARTQSLMFSLELKTGARELQKTITISIAFIDNGAEDGGAGPVPAGDFTIQMFKADRLIGFRKKTMTDLVKLTTGLVTAVDDPARSGSAIRGTPPSQSVSILGLAMGIAKYLAEKKTADAKTAAQTLSRKRKMAVRFDGSTGKTVRAEIELRTE